jgi:hypothetical protein
MHIYVVVPGAGVISILSFLMYWAILVWAFWFFLAISLAVKNNSHIFCADCLVTSTVKKKTLKIVGPPLRANKHRRRHILISFKINVCPHFLRRSKYA